MAAEKVRFGSDAWITGLQRSLSVVVAEQRTVADGIRFQILETATDVPADLAAERQVDRSLSWHIVFDGPHSRAGRGRVKVPDIALSYDYQAILPLARWVYEEGDEPAVARFRAKMMREGTLRVAGRAVPAPPALAALLRDLHNRIALITA